MKGLTLYHCARSHTFFLYGYWHNPLPTSLLPLRECKDSRGVCVFASLYSCEQEWVRDVYRSRAHRKTEENGRVVFMWGKEREWACVCFCQIMKVFFFGLEFVRQLRQTKSIASPCIPQTEGGGPEINREGARGGDLATWNGSSFPKAAHQSLLCLSLLCMSGFVSRLHGDDL